MKHAFLITAHAYFEQLTDIIELLSSSSSSSNHYFLLILIKNLGGGENYIKVCSKKFSNVFFLEDKERMAVSHGGYS